MSGEFRRKMHRGKQPMAASKESGLAEAIQSCHDSDLSVYLGVLDQGHPLTSHIPQECCAALCYIQFRSLELN